MKHNIFFDTSALFSALLSKKGAARELIRLAVRHQIKIIISNDVIVEATRNITNKAPDYLMALNLLLDIELWTVMVDPPLELVHEAESYVEEKDAMIVAVAIISGATYLATFDRKHLINPSVVRQKSGLVIDTPGNILQLVRTQLQKDNLDNG